MGVWVVGQRKERSVVGCLGVWKKTETFLAALPQSDRRFSLWVPKKIPRAQFFFRLWVLDLAVAAARRRSLRFVANCAVNSLLVGGAVVWPLREFLVGLVGWY